MSGVINLYQVVQHDSLDFFVCLSSGISITGNAGQASYAAANAVLDSFCRWARMQGLTALSVNLPAVSDVGYVAKTAGPFGDTNQYLGCSISEEQILLFMQAAISARDTLVPDESAATNHSQSLIGVPFDPHLASQSWAQAPLFSQYNRLCSDSSGGGGSSGRNKAATNHLLKDVLHSHTDFHEAFRVVFDAVSKRIAGIMMISEDISPEDRIVDLGLDSLIAVELRNWFVKQMDVNLTVVDIVNSGTVAQLVRVILERSGIVEMP